MNTSPEAAQPDTGGPTETRFEAERAAVVAELGRNDTKASALLAALGLPLSVMVVEVPQHALGPVTTALVMLGGIGLVAAALLALRVLRPRLGQGEPGTWVYWALCSREELAADLAADHGPAPLQLLARLALAKYRALRWAVDCAGAALVVLAAALASALV